VSFAGADRGVTHRLASAVTWVVPWPVGAGIAETAGAVSRERAANDAVEAANQLNRVLVIPLTSSGASILNMWS
jgi:hypothetical protein